MTDLPELNDLSLLCEDAPEVEVPRAPPTIEEMQGPFFVSDDPQDARRYCDAIAQGLIPDPYGNKY